MGKVGVHLSNDGKVDCNQLHGLGLVKGLVRLDLDYEPTDYQELGRRLDPGCDVILRLFWPGWVEPQKFVKKTKEKLPPILDALGNRRVWIEIHNEPNHRSGIEGWGATKEQANDFRIWYFKVHAGLWPQFLNLGFPGLAVGEWGNGERTWARICRDAIQASDFVSCHCYWQTPEQMDDIRLGRNWAWYQNQFPGKPIIITEAGNSSCDNPSLPQMTPERQAAEYSKFARQADVRGIAFFLLGGTDDWAGFRIWPETLEALRDYQG